jgi:hypothetical protein
MPNKLCRELVHLDVGQTGVQRDSEARGPPPALPVTQTACGAVNQATCGKACSGAVGTQRRTTIDGRVRQLTALTTQQGN